MTIELSPQLESALANEATRLGTTPQSLAVQLIESQLPAATNSAEAKAGAAPAKGELDDWWKKHLASLPPPSNEPRPEWLRSDNVSEAVGKILEERRREGRL